MIKEGDYVQHIATLKVYYVYRIAGVDHTKMLLLSQNSKNGWSLLGTPEQYRKINGRFV